MRRVVLTGLGLVSPIGCGVEATWSRILAGESGARRIEEFDASDLACQIGCFIPHGATADGKYNPDDWMEPKEQRKVDDFIIYAMVAAGEALQDSGWAPKTYEDQARSGVLIGSGIGGLQGIEKAALLLAEKGPRRISPFFIPAHQPCFWLRFYHVQSERSEPRRGHRLFDRRSRHRRCGSAHRMG